MRLVGTMGRVIPVNAFSVPVFEDEDGKRYIQVEDDRLISRFEELIPDGPDEPVEWIAIDSGLSVKEHDPAVFCFLLANGELIYGDYDTIRPRLNTLLLRDDLNIIARLSIAVFLNYHGRAAFLVREANRLYSKHGVNLILRIHDFIRAESGNKRTMHSIHPVLDRSRTILQQYPELKWTDFFYFRTGEAIFNNRRYPLSLFLAELPASIIFALKNVPPVEILIRKDEFGLFKKCLEAEHDLSLPEEESFIINEVEAVMEAMPAPDPGEMPEAEKMNMLISQSEQIKEQFKRKSELQYS